MFFWLIVFIFLFELGGAMNPFRNIANDFITQRFVFVPETSGKILLILYLQPVILTPFFGILFDKKGKRLMCTILAIILQIIAHFILTLDKSGGPEEIDLQTPIHAMAILGLFYSMFRVVVISQIPMVIRNKKVLGTAFGI